MKRALAIFLELCESQKPVSSTISLLPGGGGCIHHSSFLILHSPQGTLDIPWTCPIPIEPPQTPVFHQPSLSRSLCCGISAPERFNLKNASEPTQRRKGAKTQGFRRVGTFTRLVSKFKPVFPSPSPCPLRLCLLASTLRSSVHPPQWCYGGRATEDGSLR
jgi:hypothetical protein